ncbi:MAG TPA: NAD-dependent epimerase/dehydratase family protein [Candidatus Binatia bacterium]|jgi:UDP-glucose 4-epimerase
MKIVVTGGAGFIASHVVDGYVARGHEVFVIDNLSSGEKKNLNPKATLYSMDVVDPKLPGVIGEIRPDVLNHHAAQIDVRRSVSDPVFDAKVNVLGFLNLLEAGRTAGVKKVIFSSSGGAIYGDQEKFPAPEEHPTRPASPYGVSKLTGENYLVYYHATFGIPYIALRYANVYGPRQSFRGEAGVIAIFIDQLLSGNTPVINGDGEQTRDYVYVGDVAAANMLALDSSFVGSVNIGTGVETDLNALYTKLAAGLRSKVAPIHGAAKEGEQRRSVLDAARAKKILGWTPKTSLDQGLADTIDFYRKAKAS